MVKPTPKIDERTAADIAKQVQDLLKTYAPDWQEFELDPVTGDRKPKGISAALIGVFARFAEIIIQRLNQVPDKNFLAFLNLLGASRLPPQPARVPLTFFLTAGSTVDAIVPAGTQVAAPPAEGEKDSIIFETERELVVTAATLKSILVRTPEQDKYADYSKIDDLVTSSSVSLFEGDTQIEHILYLGHNTILGYPNLQELRLKFELTKEIPNPLPRTVQWEIWDGEQGISLTFNSDATSNLTKNGEIVFPITTEFPQQAVNGLTSCWVRCQLKTPITPALAEQLPDIKTVTIQVTAGRNGSAVEKAFTNLLPVDLSKDFYPFGEKPKFNDTFYLTNADAFSQIGAEVTLNIELTNSISSNGIELKWEFYNGKIWKTLGTYPKTDSTSEPNFKFEDSTNAFTKKGSVKFTLIEKPEKTEVNGVTAYWIRVRIVNGNYGKEAGYTPVDPKDLTNGYIFKPATFTPPSINSITVSYTVATKSGELPEVILTYNDFVYKQEKTSFKPFQPTSDKKRSLYLGFAPPANRNFPNRPISLYFRLADILYGTKPDELSPASPPRLLWEYFNGQTWQSLTVRDETQAFSRLGIVEVLPPANFAQKTEFERDHYWLRVQWVSGDYQFKPKLQLQPKLQPILLNTTFAAQTVTIRDEILGSSDGTENQKFRTTRSPILKDQQLQVRELEMPSVEEQNRIKQAEGDNAISLILDATGRPQEIWVRWHEVSDFYGSQSRDRHYVLDHLTGEIQFGNGLNGLIPPIGTGNLRMTQYQTGGGTGGNKPVESIVQLKTTIPYIGKVTNYEAASGGANAESLNSLLERAPRTIRHGERAVTLEDYEDLAILATPEVARAKCVPIRNLVDDPLDLKPTVPGDVSIIIVPRSSDIKPLPSMELLNRVQDYLKIYAIPTANIAVVGALYVSVSVTADIALTSLEGASTVERAVSHTLTRFLHPLTGGLDEKGWDFGREPHKSDFYALLEAIPGVDYIRTLDVKETEDLPGTKQTGRFLVYSGKHNISLVFEKS